MWCSKQSAFFFKRGNSVTKSTQTAGQSNLYVILNDFLNVHFSRLLAEYLSKSDIGYLTFRIKKSYLETLEKWTKFSWFFSEFKFVENTILNEDKLLTFLLKNLCISSFIVKPWSRTTDAQRRNSLHCTAEISIPIPNFWVRRQHILSATSAQFFRYLWFMPSLGVRSPWTWALGLLINSSA